ncbi:sterile alpha motif domain-containing protein 13 isoform X3 [Strigops habroptila]|uniref:sterile alpha motif domain-containing protein 13 isoform X3 n=1 Tax=Strigops habroptila TaxID=2489341 RepID=UPI0011CFBE94|nr:sterile alpha motif domain-containing protein 13 isoform X3 [Strigops habroptila]
MMEGRGELAEVKETSILPMLTVDMENKENGSLDVKNSVENGRPPDPADWAVTDVVNYFRTAGFEEQANAFQEQLKSRMGYLTFPRQQKLMANHYS